MSDLFSHAVFTSRIRARMADLGFSQLEVATTSRVSPSVLCRVLGGKSPSVENYLRLLAWMDADHWHCEAGCGKSAGERRAGLPGLRCVNCGAPFSPCTPETCPKEPS